MFEAENIPSEKKHVVSMRLTNNDRNGMQNLSSRLFIRESDLYRFAVNCLLSKMNHLNDEGNRGSDLLPLFVNFRAEINEFLKLNKQQLYKIINAGNAHPDKLVSMEDIELLLLSDMALRNKLIKIREALAFKNKNTSVWLQHYFDNKYHIEISEELPEFILDITQECDA